MTAVVVIGAGVGGLSTALVLSRAGHQVTVIERDATPLPNSALEAFEWDRRGAPQVRHSHALLARLRNSLRDRYPDVLADLLDAGAAELDFIAMMPDDMDRSPLPGDEDIVALACRRTTFEWVLRRDVLRNPAVTLLDGRAVASLLTQPSDLDIAEPPRVIGVRLDDGSEVHGDLVVAAGGRRGGLPGLLAPLGIDLEEESEDTGIIYYTRFYRLADGAEYPEQTGVIGGDLGYVKYGVFPGDNRTFSITHAVGTIDDQFRKLVRDEAVFQAVSANIPATAPYVDGRAEPIGPIQVMAQLLNRSRRFLDAEGQPKLLGLSALGDEHTCTNPLYGRGCSLAFVQAELLLRSLTEHPDDETARVVTYENFCRREVRPWYKAAVAQDAATATDRLRHAGVAPVQEAAPAEAEPAPTEAAPAEPAAPESAASDNPIRDLLRDGLRPALRVDPLVLRAFLRMFNLLDPPNSLMQNHEVIGRVLTVYQDRDSRPPEPALGPDRQTMLAALGVR